MRHFVSPLSLWLLAQTGPTSALTVSKSAPTRSGTIVASLLQRSGAPAPPDGSVPCIPAPLERLLAPGSRRTEWHIYDKNCLSVVRHALATDGRFGLVALRPNPPGVRSFALLPVACEMRVLSWRAATRESKEGDASASIIADVVATRRLVPGKVLQYEPYLAVEMVTFEEQRREHLTDSEAEACLGAWRALEEYGASVEALRSALPELGEYPQPGVAQAVQLLRGEHVEGLVEAEVEGVVEAEVGAEVEAGAEAAMEAAVEGEVGGEVVETADADTMRLSALGSTRLLSTEARYAALEEAELFALLERVSKDLATEADRLRAIKALRSALPRESPP